MKQCHDDILLKSFFRSFTGHASSSPLSLRMTVSSHSITGKGCEFLLLGRSIIDVFTRFIVWIRFLDPFWQQESSGFVVPPHSAAGVLGTGYEYISIDCVWQSYS